MAEVTDPDLLRRLGGGGDGGGGGGEVTDPDLLRKLNAPRERRPMSWTDVATGAAANLVPSAGRFVGDIYQAVRHPLDTGMNLANLVSGGLEKAYSTPAGRFAEYTTLPTAMYALGRDRGLVSDTGHAPQAEAVG